MPRHLEALQLLQNLQLPVLVTDEAGVVTMVNDPASALYGGSPEDLVGRRLGDLVADPGDRVSLVGWLSGSSGGGLWRREVPVRRQDGETFLARLIATPLPATAGGPGLVVVAEDVTELRAAEAEQRAADRRLRLALEAAQLGTWHWDAATGRNLWDRRLEQIYGLPPGGFEETWDAWMALIHPDDRADVVDTVTAAWADPAPYLLTTRVVWPDGRTVRWIEAWGQVTTDEHGRPTGTIGCVRDVTRERETEAALAAAREAEVLASRRTALLLEVTADLAGAENVIEVRRAMEHHLGKFIAELGDEACLELPSALRSVRTGADLAHEGYDRLAESERTILDSLATQCASAVHRVELMARTTEIAEDLQQGLAASPLPTDLDGVELAVRYFPGGDELEHVGGDWYDAVRTRDGHLAVVVGDVMGRGVRAATTMVRVRAALRGLIAIDPTPEVLLAFADDVLERDAPDQFVTAAAALLDPHTRSLRLCLAGHVPIVLVHPDGGTGLLGEESGIPLGVQPDEARHACLVDVPHGGTVIVVTDGVVESRSRDLDEGLDRLRQRASALREGSLEDLVDGLAALADSTMRDDVTVLAIRMR